MDTLIACICEGGAEQAIMDILLKNDALIFEKHQLLEERVIRTRSASNFERDYLNMNFNKKITIYRVIDSRNEKFKLSSLYKHKVQVMNVITAPEIEMLIIHSENAYDSFKRSRKKPSEYCIVNLKYSNVKSYAFVEKYFSDVRTLFAAIKAYHQKANVQKNEITLYDLVKLKK